MVGMIGAAFVLVVVLVLLLIRRRRRWSPAGRTPGQMALLSQAEVDRALRRAGVERPLWQPLAHVFEDLSPPDAGRFDTEPATTSAARERSASLIQDGVTVTHTADAALFDPLGTSDRRARCVRSRPAHTEGPFPPPNWRRDTNEDHMTIDGPLPR